MIEETCRISRLVGEHQKLVDAFFSSNKTEILAAGRVIAKCLEKGNCVFWFGNGGSAADSQHLAAELVGRFVGDRPALRSVALTTDSSIITSVANDYRFEDVFSRQIAALGRAGDLAIGISTSGNSANVLNGLVVAKNAGLSTLALLGNEGGDIASVADNALIVRSNVTARIQEVHIMLGHLLCEIVEAELGFGA